MVTSTSRGSWIFSYGMPCRSSFAMTSRTARLPLVGARRWADVRDAAAGRDVWLVGGGDLVAPRLGDAPTFVGGAHDRVRPACEQVVGTLTVTK
mgnify:CR=1 FL=1